MRQFFRAIVLAIDDDDQRRRVTTVLTRPMLEAPREGQQVMLARALAVCPYEIRGDRGAERAPECRQRARYDEI